MDKKVIYLSYYIDNKTPTYGNRSKFALEKKSAIKNGDVANESFIFTTTHIGTHLDLPYHFYEYGDTIESYPPDFWIFNEPLFIDLVPRNPVICDELIEMLEQIQDKSNYDILIVKTGIGQKRYEKEFWEKNFGFSPLIYDYLAKNFENLRIFGFDSISVSSFSNRKVGREAHKKFLNPDQPILLLEDMNLSKLNQDVRLIEVIIAPILISGCDGLPCTVFGFTVSLQP